MTIETQDSDHTARQSRRCMVFPQKLDLVLLHHDSSGEGTRILLAVWIDPLREGPSRAAYRVRVMTVGHTLPLAALGLARAVSLGGR